MSQAAIYARVSTDEQSLDSQIEETWTYVTDDLGIPESNIQVLTDKSTGTNTDRSDYREMMSLAEAGELDHVIVREVSRIARNMRDLNETIGHLVDDHGVSVHIIDAGLHLGQDTDDSLFDDRMILQILGIAAELEAKLTQERTLAGLAAAEAAGKHTGRPPFGFTTDDEGYLIPDEDFDTALSVIERVDEMGKSVRSTAKHADVSRSTVRNILDRKEMYLEQYSSSEVA